MTKYLADQTELDGHAGESTGQKVNVMVEGKEGNACCDYDVFKGNKNVLCSSNQEVLLPCN